MLAELAAVNRDHWFDDLDGSNVAMAPEHKSGPLVLPAAPEVVGQSEQRVAGGPAARGHLPSPGSRHENGPPNQPGTKSRPAIEPPQGGGDDTAGNDVEFSCTDSSMIHAPGGLGWGSWGGLSGCPAQSAVCGLSIKFEDWEGANGDDTAMNGLSLDCCSL